MLTRARRLTASKLIASPGLFRVLLACVVVVNHSVPIHLGSAAVYLFFMLSGYWVHEMWAREYATTRGPYVTFLVSRAWRLLPVYYVALGLFMLLNAWLGSGRALAPVQGGLAAAHFCFSQLFILGYAPLPPALKFIPPVWSLDIELQFYLVAPALILLLARYRVATAPALLLHGAALAGFVVFLVFFGNIHAQSAFLPMYLVFFLVGLHSARGGWTPHAPAALAGVGAAAAMVALCIAMPATRPLLVEGSFSGWLTAYNPDANIVLAMLVAPYAMATVRQAPARGTRAARIDRDLSNITYEIYLLHWDVLGVVEHFWGHLSKYRQLPAIAASWLVLLPLSWAVYRWIDQPIERRRKAYVRSRQASLPTAIAATPVDYLEVTS